MYYEDVEDDFLLHSLDVEQAKFGFVISLPIEASNEKIIE